MPRARINTSTLDVECFLKINGGELFVRLCTKESYTEYEARAVVEILLETLAFLHSKSIAHRDLKPENLLLKSLVDDTQVLSLDKS